MMVKSRVRRYEESSISVTFLQAHQSAMPYAAAIDCSIAQHTVSITLNVCLICKSKRLLMKTPVLKTKEFTKYSTCIHFLSACQFSSARKIQLLKRAARCSKNVPNKYRCQGVGLSGKFLLSMVDFNAFVFRRIQHNFTTLWHSF